jgi:hypothetical protein
MGLHEVKKLLHNKRNVSKLKRPPTEWKKIFVSYTSDKGLITRIYWELKKLNSLDLMSTYEGEHTIFGLLSQANLTQNDVLQFHPFTSE